jgi:disulfide bond formation protein DsbB
MKVIVGVISRSIQSFVYIALLLFLFVFIYALLGRQIYAGELSFDDNPVRQNFDTVVNSLTTTFQILTLENWNTLNQEIMRSNVN